MAIKDAFKISRKTYFNPTAWLGIGELRAYTRILWGSVRLLFRTPTPEYTETFAQSVKRQHLTKENLKQTANNFLIYTIIFVVLGGITFATSFYMLFGYGTFVGWILANLVTILFLVQAFRFHFWYFQIVNKKLGCTFREWWRGKIHDRKPKP